MRGLGQTLLVWCAGAALLAASGCAVQVAAVGPTYAPPPPRVVQVDYRPGYVWIDGRWNWSYDRWVWQPGYWVRERPGYHYAAGQWVNRGGRYVYLEGTWRRGDKPRRQYRRAVRRSGGTAGTVVRREGRDAVDSARPSRPRLQRNKRSKPVDVQKRGSVPRR